MPDEYCLESDELKGILWSAYRWGLTEGADGEAPFSPETLLAAMIDRHGLQTEPDPTAQAADLSRDAFLRAVAPFLLSPDIETRDTAATCFDHVAGPRHLDLLRPALESEPVRWLRDYLVGIAHELRKMG